MSKYSYTPQRDGYVFSKKRKKKTSVFRVALVVIVVFAAFCIGILYFLLFGDFWNVTSIRVEGSRLIEDTALISSTIAELNTESAILGVAGHDNILFWMFRKNPMEITRIPEAREVFVTTDFSKRTVHIKVIERTIRAVVCTQGSSECFGIDEGGIVFSRVPWIEGSLIPRFENASGTAISVGKKYFRKDEWFENVLTTVAALKKKELIPSFIRIKEESSGEWEAVMPSGIKFYFSLSFVPEDIEKIIEDIATRASLEGISYFDLRIENKVYYK